MIAEIIAKGVECQRTMGCSE